MSQEKDSNVKREMHNEIMKNLLKKESGFRKIVVTNDKFYRLLQPKDALRVFNEELEELQEQEMTDSSQVNYLYFSQVLNTYSKFLSGDPKNARKVASLVKRAYEKLQKVDFEKLEKDDERVNYYSVWRNASCQDESTARKKLLRIEKHVKEMEEKNVLESEKIVNGIYAELYRDLGNAEFCRFRISTEISRKYYEMAIDYAKKAQDAESEYKTTFKLYSEVVDHAIFIRKMKKKYQQKTKEETPPNNKRKKKKKTGRQPKKTERELAVEKLELDGTRLDEKVFLYDGYVNLMRCFYEYPNPKQNPEVLQKIQYQLIFCLYEMRRYSEGLVLLQSYISKCQKVYGAEYKELEGYFKLEGKIFEKLGQEYYELAIGSFTRASGLANSSGKYEESGKLKVRCRKLKQAIGRTGRTGRTSAVSVVKKRRFLEYRVCSSPFCGKLEKKTKEFKCCSRCKTSHYCCRDCQVNGWKLVHKKECELYCNERKRKENEIAMKREAELEKKRKQLEEKKKKEEVKVEEIEGTKKEKEIEKENENEVNLKIEDEGEGEKKGNVET